MSHQEQITSNNSSKNQQDLSFSKEEIDNIFVDVLRQSTEKPGFYYKDLGSDLGSISFRKLMLAVKEQLSELCKNRRGKQINYQWMSRANHRNTSNFHIDTAPEESILILGYEPTTIESKVYLADFTKYLEEKDLEAQDYFRNSVNGNFAPDDEELTPYVSELTPFPKGHYRLVIINNSRSYGQKSYGVFHRGEVPNNLEQEDRIVNAVMIAVCEMGVEESCSEYMISDFAKTDLVSQ